LMTSPNIERKAERLRRKGYKPYIVEPRGRSAPLLSLGYVNALLELVGQLAERKISLDYLYLSAANMTEAGLALAARALGLRLKIVGISPIKWQEPRPVDIADLTNCTAEILGLNLQLSPNQIPNWEEYDRDGYA